MVYLVYCESHYLKCMLYKLSLVSKISTSSSRQTLSTPPFSDVISNVTTVSRVKRRTGEVSKSNPRLAWVLVVQNHLLELQ